MSIPEFHGCTTSNWISVFADANLIICRPEIAAYRAPDDGRPVQAQGFGRLRGLRPGLI